MILKKKVSCKYTCAKKIACTQPHPKQNSPTLSGKKIILHGEKISCIHSHLEKKSFLAHERV